MSIPSVPEASRGDPGYPSPWTTSLPLEGLRDTDDARIISLAPDVCLTPIGSTMEPIPYPVVDYCGHNEGYTESVRFTGQKAMVLRSNTTHVHGDSPGVDKGTKSGTVGGICEPIGYSTQVKAEGSYVVRHLDRFWMNNRNTEGEALFIRGVKTFAPPVDDDPIPGSLKAKPVQLAYNGNPAELFSGQAAPQQTAAARAPGGGALAFLAPAGAAAEGAVGTGTAATAGGGAAAATGGGAVVAEGTAATAGVGLGTVLTGVGVFAVALLWPTNKATLDDVIPQDEFERQTVAKAYKDINATHFWQNGSDIREKAMDDIFKHREAKKKPVTEVKPAPMTKTDVQVDQKEKTWKCLIGEYSKIYDECTAMGGNTHHIVPDMVYRLGARPKGAAMGTTANRIPNSPTLNQGMSICLTPAQHGSGPTGIHGRLRGPLNEAGSASPVPGTAPMGKILAASNKSLLDTPGLAPECKARGAARATVQVNQFTGMAVPGRTLEAPLPTGRAAQVLSQGHY
jgi:hypothetical protein